MEDRRPAYARDQETDRAGPGKPAVNGAAWDRTTSVEEIGDFGSLTDVDLHYLVMGADVLRTGQSAERILLAVASGKGYMLRIRGKARGVITGQILIHPAGKEFSMGVFAGEKIFPSQIVPLAESVFDWARGKGCRWVRFENIHPVLDRFYGRVFDRVATVFVKEISDGR